MSDLLPEENSQKSTATVTSGCTNIFKKLVGTIKKQKPDSKPPTGKPLPPLVNMKQPAEQTADMKANIKKLWGATLGPSTLPGATIKISSLAPRPSLPSHIPLRQFSLPQQTKAAESDYTILEKIADGGMGSVFIAQQSSLKRRVAIKTIKEDAINDEENYTQFLTEALVTGDLDHPNIVPIYELGSNGDGFYFYAMKHVHGISWDECIQKKSQDENLDILMKVSDAVAFAHSRKIIHRDLKPGNIMIGEFGEVLLMDWGLASYAKPGEESDLFSSRGTLGGTPAYMPPECASGDGSKIGTATDVYLIGALLYEVVSGKAPHDKTKAEDSLEAAVKNEIPKLNTQSELLTIALKAMETEPEDRYSSVLELQEHIRNYRQHEESLTLTSNAENNYTRARVNESYGEFSAGMHACYEALKLWQDNKIARELRSKLRLDYARLSMKRGDYDLCLTLLRDDNREDRKLIRKVTRLRNERALRLELQKRLKYALLGTVIITLLIMITAYSTVSRQRTQAIYDNFVTQTRLAEQLLQEGNWVEVGKISASIPASLRGWEWNWIDNASRIKLKAKMKLPEAPMRVVSSPDGTHQALIFPGGKIHLNTPSGSLPIFLSGEITDFHWFKENGKMQATVLHQNIISTLSHQSGKSWQAAPLKKQLPDNTRIVSPSGKFYLVQMPSDQIAIYSSESGSLVSRLEQPPESQLKHLVFSKNEKLIAAIDENKNRLKTFDVQTGNLIERSAPHSEYASSTYTQLEFIKDDSLLMVSGKGNVIYICNVRHMNLHVTIPLQSQPTSIAVSPREDEILASTAKGEIILFHIPTSSIIWHIQQKRHTISSVAATNTGKDWLLFDQNGQVYPLSESVRQTGQKLLQNEVPVLAISWSPSTSSMITKDQRNRYVKMDVTTREKISFKLKSRRHSPHHLISINGQDHLAVLHRHDGLLLVNLHTLQRKLFPRFQSYQAMVPRGNTLLLASGKQIACFDPVTESELSSWQLDVGPIRTICLVGESDVWIATHGNHLHKLNLKSGKIKLQEKAPADVIGWVPDPSGKYVIANARSREAYIYNTKNGKIQATLSGSTHVITDLLLTPDGRRLIGSSADGKIRIWDTESWDELVNFRAHIGTATQVGMSSDGTHLFSAGTDGAVRIWSSKAVSTNTTSMR